MKKQHGGNEVVYTNSAEVGVRTEAPHYSLYVNPYFMMYDDDHVNKHIYIDNERVAVKKFLLSSVLGGYTVENLQSAAGYNIADINYDSIRGVQESIIADSYTEFDLPFPETNRGNNQYFAFIPSSGRFIAPSDTIAEEPTDEERLIPNPVSFTHYYVSDHIGSTRLVSNEQGRIVQSLLYTPTGELLLDRQYIDGYHGDFQFSGKEVDEETGLSYFGARYLDSHKNIWLSPDPLQLKSPHVSSYAFCMGNPVRFIDPEGKKIVNADGQNAVYYSGGNIVFTKYATHDIRRIVNVLNTIPEGRKILRQVINSPTKVRVSISSDTRISGSTYTYGETTQGNWNPNDNYGRYVASDGTYRIKEAFVEIFEGTLVEDAKTSNAKHKGLTIDQAIGAVAAHEFIHATDIQEINKDIHSEMKKRVRENREIKPNQIERNVINQFLENRGE